MQTALDLSTEELDPSEQASVAKVREHGFFRTTVFGDADGPEFSFSTGFWVNAARPELIIFSVKREIAHDVFWDLFQDAKVNKQLPLGQKTDQVFENSPAYIFPVAQRFYADHLGWSIWFYGGTEFPCLQIVWPDRSGFFPWEEEFDTAFVGDQPDLTENGWKASLV